MITERQSMICWIIIGAKLFLHFINQPKFISQTFLLQFLWFVNFLQICQTFATRYLSCEFVDLAFNFYFLICFFCVLPTLLPFKASPVFVHKSAISYLFSFTPILILCQFEFLVLLHLAKMLKSYLIRLVQPNVYRGHYCRPVDLQSRNLELFWSTAA